MTARKFRQPVVLDTNVFIRSFKTRSVASPNRRILHLWLLEKQLQLIISRELMDEYLEIFEEVLGMNAGLIARWRRRFEKDPRTTLINLGRRHSESRDPDDNIVLATARAGRADFLITNDRDLLELTSHFRKTLPFEVVTPIGFMKMWNGD